MSIMKQTKLIAEPLSSPYWRLGLLAFLIAAILTPSMPLISSNPGRLSFLWLDRREWKGKAEIANYSGTVTRYRQRREADLSLITVVEPFNMQQLVKSEQEGPLVLKQNQVISFQTGVYPYNQMNSLFWRADGGQLLKATMSSQEWCGHTFKELRPEGGHLQLSYSSYWEGEGRSYQRISMPRISISEERDERQLILLYDELALAVRSPQFLSSQKIFLFPLLMSSQVLRPDWDVGKPARKPRFFPARVEKKETRLQLGSKLFKKVILFQVSFRDVSGREVSDKFFVNYGDPNRTLLQWERHDGSKFVLTGLYFSDYWNQNGIGDKLKNNRLSSLN